MGLFLGLDLGTSKTAAVLVDGGARRCVGCSGAAHGAASGGGTQDLRRHLDAVRAVVAALPEADRRRVSGVAVSCQMHGVVLWNDSGAVSPLYTWQSRVDDLDALCRLPGCGRLNHGFGGATLGMLGRRNELARWTRCGTVGDYLVWLLTGRPGRVLIDRSNAASWGLMPFDGSDFDLRATAALGIPEGLLPHIVPVGASAGVTDAEWSAALGIPVGTTVLAAVGDNQASVRAAVGDPERDISLTLGTGAQISAVVPIARAREFASRTELRPYLGNACLAVGAPLCGGEAWTALMRFWRSGFAAANEKIDDAELFRLLDASACAELERAGLPRFVPSFLGERADATARGRLEELTLDNFDFGKVAAALARGLMENLRRMLPAELLTGRTRLALSGNGFRRNKSLRRAAELVFGMPAKQSVFDEEAACGAALFFG